MAIARWRIIRLPIRIVTYRFFEGDTMRREHRPRHTPGVVSAALLIAGVTASGITPASAQDASQDTTGQAAETSSVTPSTSATTAPDAEGTEDTESSTHDQPEAPEAATCAPVTALVPVASKTAADKPTNTPQGLFSEVVGPVAGDAELAENLESIFIPYKAKGSGEAGEVYSQTLTDGYARLTQTAHRVTRACPDTRLVLMGQGQAGHLVSFFASEIGAGNAVVDPDKILFAATVSDPTRAAGESVFPGVPGQAAPEDWESSASSSRSSTSGASGSAAARLAGKSSTGSGSSGSDSTGENGETQAATSITEYADLSEIPEGSGLNPQSQHISDFGSLQGRVAQFCVSGDLSCAAPNNAALGRAGLAIANASDADFSRDPLGAASITAQAVSATAATGVAKHSAKDWEGDTLEEIAPTAEHSLSERLEQAATPGARPAPELTKPGEDSKRDSKGTEDEDNTTVTEDSLEALVRIGSIGVNALSVVAEDVLDEETIASLIASGVTGGATSPQLTATLAAKAGASALELVPPRSLGTRAKNVFEALAGEVNDNSELPELIASARTWNVLATQDGYIKAPVSASGASTTVVLADWLGSAVRDVSAKAAEASESANPTSTTSAPSDAPSGTDGESTSSTSETTAPTSSAAEDAGSDTSTSAAPRPAWADTNTRPAPGRSLSPSPVLPYDKDTDTGEVTGAGPEVKAAPAVAAAGLFTVAGEQEAPNYAEEPVNITEAGKNTPASNTSYTVAQRLALLADPAYPRKNALQALAVTGAMLPASYGSQTRL